MTILLALLALFPACMLVLFALPTPRNLATWWLATGRTGEAS